MRRSARLSHQVQNEPPPKRERHTPPVEKARPQFAYSVECEMPVSLALPEYSLLENALPPDDSGVLAYSLYTSRTNWLACSMFKRYWQRRPRGKKLSEGETNARDTMTKLCECSLEMGPHVFSARLFTVRDEAADKKAAEEAEAQAKLDEEKCLKAELLRKQEKEKQAKEAEEQKLQEQKLQEQKLQEQKLQEQKLQEQKLQEQKLQDERQRVTNLEASANIRGVGPSPTAISASLPETIEMQAEQHYSNQETSTLNTVTTQAQESQPLPAPKNEGVDVSHRQNGVSPGSETAPLTETAWNVDQPSEPSIVGLNKEVEPNPTSKHPDKVSVIVSEVSQVEAETATSSNGYASSSSEPADVGTHRPTHSGAPMSKTGISNTEPATEVAPAVASAAPTGSIAGTTIPTAPVSTSPVVPAAAPTPDPQQRAVSNQMVVARLQKLAKRDQALNELMREVATGNAPPSAIARFQLYINKARAMDVGKKPPKAASKPAATAPMPSTLAPAVLKKPAKHIMLAFELDENPAERFLIDKNSILELLPDGAAVVSFLHVQPRKRQSSIYTPVTIAIRDISTRVYAVLERCFSPAPEVRASMAKIIQEGVRSDDLYVWQAIEVADTALLEKIKKLPEPMQAVQQWRRIARARNAFANQAAAPAKPREHRLQYPSVPTELKAELKVHSTLSQTTSIAEPVAASTAPVIKIEAINPTAAIAPPTTQAGSQSTSTALASSAASSSGSILTTGGMTADSAMAPDLAAPEATSQHLSDSSITANSPRVGLSASPPDSSQGPSIPPENSGTASSVTAPRLNLPSLDSFVFPQGEMPPLPPSMRKRSDSVMEED